MGAEMAIAPLVGMMSDAFNSNRQAHQNREMQWRQFNYQKALNEQGAKLGRDTWDYTNYENTVKHMRNAGLSVGMMYGGSGAGGATTSTPSGGGASSASVGMAGSGASAGIGAMAQLGLMEAQKKNIEADTASKVADLPVKEKEALLKGSQKANLDVDTSFKLDTINDRELQEQAKAVQGFIENDLLEQNIKTQKAQIEQKAEEIAQGWRALDQKDREIAIDKFEAELKALYPKVGEVLGGELNQLVQKLRLILNVKDGAKKVNPNNQFK